MKTPEDQASSAISEPYFARLGKATISSEAYQLKALRQRDIFEIMTWRNQQKDVLRQNHIITADMQAAYYRDHIKPQFAQQEPRQMLFSLLLEDTCIGYGGLTNLDWYSRKAEVSFLVATQRVNHRPTYQQDFTHFLTMLKQLAFQQLNLQRLFTETYAQRRFHIEILEANGFELEGRMRRHVRIGEHLVDALIHGCLAPGKALGLNDLK